MDITGITISHRLSYDKHKRTLPSKRFTTSDENVTVLKNNSRYSGKIFFDVRKQIYIGLTIPHSLSLSLAIEPTFIRAGLNAKSLILTIL